MFAFGTLVANVRFIVVKLNSYFLITKFSSEKSASINFSINSNQTTNILLILLRFDLAVYFSGFFFRIESKNVGRKGTDGQPCCQGNKAKHTLTWHQAGIDSKRGMNPSSLPTSMFYHLIHSFLLTFQNDLSISFDTHFF